MDVVMNVLVGTAIGFFAGLIGCVAVASVLSRRLPSANLLAHNTAD